MRSPEAIKRAQDKFRNTHPDYWRIWLREHPESRKKYHKTKRRKEWERNYRRKYLQNRRDNDPRYRLWKASKDKEYRKTPKGKIRLFRTKIRRRSHNDTYQLTTEQWQFTLDAFRNACAYCFAIDNLTQDHFIPLNRGGRAAFGNLIPACSHCNSSKGDRMPDNWCNSEQLSCVLDILNKLVDAQPPP